MLYDPASINRFGQSTVIIPIEVIDEIGSFNRDMSELGQNARAVAACLDEFRSRGRLGEGVKLDNGGLLMVYCGQAEDYLSRQGLQLSNAVENRILNLAVHLNEKDPEQPTIIISKSS